MADASRHPINGSTKGDIKGRFDNIDHHLLMERVSARVTDDKITR